MVHLVFAVGVQSLLHVITPSQPMLSTVSTAILWKKESNVINKRWDEGRGTQKRNPLKKKKLLQGHLQQFKPGKCWWRRAAHTQSGSSANSTQKFLVLLRVLGTASWTFLLGNAPWTQSDNMSQCWISTASRICVGSQLNTKMSKFKTEFTE